MSCRDVSTWQHPWSPRLIPHSCRGADDAVMAAGTSPQQLLEESCEQSVDFLLLSQDLQERRSGLVWLRLVFIYIKFCWQHSCPLFNADFVHSPSRRNHYLTDWIGFLSSLPSIKILTPANFLNKLCILEQNPFPPPRSPELAAMCLETKSSPRHLVRAGVVITSSPVVLVARSPQTCSTKATV